MDDTDASTDPPVAASAAADLSDLLRAMTTTTTIEPTGKGAAPGVPPGVPPGNASMSPLPPGDTAVRPLAASLPTTVNRSYKIYGVPTHAFCQVFSDRIVVGVTQLVTKTKTAKDTKGEGAVAAAAASSGHIGSWVYCQASQSEVDPKQVDYELSTLLGGSGNARDEKEVYARRIAERLLEKQSVPGGSNRIVLLLGISLLPVPPPGVSSVERFKTLVEVLVELIETALGIALER